MRETGLARRTVKNFLRANDFPERAPRAPRSDVLTPYEPHLQERLASGCENGQQLWRELQERGYVGSASPVYWWLTVHRTKRPTIGRRRLGRQPGQGDGSEQITPRQGAWLLQRQPEDLDEEEQEQLSQEFGRVVRERDQAAFAPWLHAVTQCGIPELQSFATGLCQDRAAVEAGLSSAFSNGQVEGQVNRVEMLKRQMYGRANFDLLRQRVLHVA